MNRLNKTFERISENKEKAFVPYIMAGDGGLDSLMERIVYLESCGATAVEIGIPFSDPVADGPTIQAAGLRALENGTTLKAVLQTILNVRPIVSIPIIVMTYMNPIYAYGITSFIEDASKAGVDGCIIPDLPIEEEDLLISHLDVADIELIRLVTLTSSNERINEIASRSRGFLYAVTVTGITGARANFHQDVENYLKNIQEISSIPVLAGFGISTPEQVKEFSQYCDGVVVGSRIVDLFHHNQRKEIEDLIKSIKTIKV